MITEHREAAKVLWKKIRSIWEMNEWTKIKGAERHFHHFILRLWKEIEDIEREGDIKGVAHSQVGANAPWVESERFF